MFENVNQPQPNQPPAPTNKDWGPWKPKGEVNKSAGPIPPPPIDPSVREANQPAPQHNPAVNMPNNINVPSGPSGAMPDLPQPSKRKYVLIGIIIFAILVLLIAAAVVALNYFSNTNSNVNNDNANAVNANIDTNINNTTNTNTTNANIANTNTNANQNTNVEIPSNLNLPINTNSNSNSVTNENSNANQNTNTIINSALLDTDGDGLTDVNEDIYGTDWINPDTDGDGFLDGDEIANDYNPLCNPATATEEGCNISLL